MQRRIERDRFWRRGLAASALLAASITTGTAQADERVACATASETGQKLRDDGKLMKARAEFLVCARDVCPQVIKKDCVDWLQTSETNLPTVVLAAKDSHGHDVTLVHVTFDGALLADKLAGKAIFVDPGQHTFRFEIPGEKPIEQRLVIHEGEKNRLVSVSLAPTAPPSTPANADATPGDTKPSTHESKSKVPAYIVGGAGIATAAVGGLFYLLAVGDYNDLKDGCGKTKTCTDSDTQPVKTKATLSYTLLGVGGGLVITGVVLYVLESASSAPTATTGVTASSKALGMIRKVGVVPLPGGGAAVFGTSF